MAFRCEEHNKDFPTRRGLANHLRWDKGIMEYCRQISKQAYAKNKNFQDRQHNQPRGEKSPSWKGDKAGLSALHIWVKISYPSETLMPTLIKKRMFLKII